MNFGCGSRPKGFQRAVRSTLADSQCLATNLHPFGVTFGEMGFHRCLGAAQGELSDVFDRPSMVVYEHINNSVSESKRKFSIDPASTSLER